MSSYLLLRNNHESGPFSLDEVKNMSLKSYDLIWVVGKSAAWRYPAEIPELATLIPSVTEERTDYLRTETKPENQATDSAQNKVPDPQSIQQSTVNSQRSAANRSIYINLPGEKKSANELSDLVFGDTGFVSSEVSKSNDDFSAFNKRTGSKAARYSGKILWVSTIVLLFGAGVMTGLFISDRRKFFSADEKRPQINGAEQAVFRSKKENTTSSNGNNAGIISNEITGLHQDSTKKTSGITRKQNNASARKTLTVNSVNKDSLAAEQALLAAIRIRDSLKQDAARKSEQLSQSIQANPEKYLTLSTGRFSTGLFGGISSFPVTVTNHSSVKIALAEVTIDYVQNNNKVFKTESLAFNDLEPGETLTIKAPKSSRGTKITSQIHVVHVQQTDSSGSSN